MGYFFFFITFLFYAGLVSLTLKKPITSGEYAMGYGLALAFLGLGFTISSLILTLNIAGKGGFHWVLDAGAKRNLLIGFGWLSIAIATFFSTAFKWDWLEGEFPQFLRWLSLHHAAIWLPLLMLIPYFLF